MTTTSEIVWNDPNTMTAQGLLRYTAVQALSLSSVQHDLFLAAFTDDEGKLTPMSDLDFRSPEMCDYHHTVQSVIESTMVCQLIGAVVDIDPVRADETARDVARLATAGEQREYLWGLCLALGLDPALISAEARSERGFL